MKYCKKCDIKILDELEYCPLCRSALCPIKELDPLDAARIRLLKEDEKRLDAREEETGRYRRFARTRPTTGSIQKRPGSR